MSALCRTIGSVCLALSLTAAQARGEAVPLVVVDGRCELVLPSDGPECHLVIGSLGAPGKTFTVRLRIDNEARDSRHEPEAPARAIPSSSSSDVSVALQDLARQAEHCRRLRLAPEPPPPRGEPLRRKVFYIFTAERDLQNPGNYTQITAELCQTGRFVQVYRDTGDPWTSDLALAAGDVVRTFDEEVYPFSRLKLGQAADVDRDGRFTVLLSSWLGRLQGGKVSLDGFVRSSDFHAEYAAPFGNRCDMLYLNAHLKAGPHLRCVLAHEYTHAVTLSEHELFNPPACRQQEESWLSEGLAHLVEDLHRHGWSNLEQRVRTYLAGPQRYPLVLADEAGNGLLRSGGSRGSAFLFLRWCFLRSNGALPQRLIRSPFVGVRNVECAMQQSFADLFRDWTVSLLDKDAWSRPLPGELRAATALGREPGAVKFDGPAIEMLTEGDHRFTLASTAVKFFRTGSAKCGRRISIEAGRLAELQVTLVKSER